MSTSIRPTSADSNLSVSSSVHLPPTLVSSCVPNLLLSSRRDVVIPLVADTAFLQLLSGALGALTALYLAITADYEARVRSTVEMISSSACPRSRGEADLYAWRDITKLWVESQIFEGFTEHSQGELTTKESETRLASFIDVTQRRGVPNERRFKKAQSREALEQFLALNVLLLDLKKVSL